MTLSMHVLVPGKGMCSGQTLQSASLMMMMVMRLMRFGMGDEG